MTRVDSIVDNHPCISPSPKLNCRLPPQWKGGTQLDSDVEGIDPDLSATGSEDADKEHRADPTVNASWHHCVHFGAYGHR
jgi:hypothetical protein